MNPTRGLRKESVFLAESGMSLRGLLGAQPDPEFELSLPKGWERHEASAESQALIEKRLSRQLMRVGSVDSMQAFGVLRNMLRQSMDEMRKQNVIGYFAPSGADLSTPFPVPASIIATIRSAPSAEGMDGYIKRLIVDEGAVPLGKNRALLRIERENVRGVGEEQVVFSSTLYITPVPGTRRRRALELLAGYGRPTDVPRNDEQIQFVHAFFDLMVASLRWKNVSEKQVLNRREKAT